jgi:hypothetical protein
MRKLIIAFICMVLLQTNSFAKPPLPPYSPVTSDLSEKLAADKDFQEFTLVFYFLTKKIKEANIGTQLVKYFNQSATALEREKIASIFGYNSDEKFRVFLLNTALRGVELGKKFPELKEYEKNKQSITQAGHMALSVTLKTFRDPAACWDMYFGLIAIWSAYCLTEPDWSTCITNAYAAISAATITCLILAE